MKFKFINGVYFILGVVITFIGFKIFEIEKAPNPVIITKDHIVRDSIYIVNDSIQLEYIYIIREINKEKDSIMNNSDSANLAFFSNYLNECDIY